MNVPAIRQWNTRLYLLGLYGLAVGIPFSMSVGQIFAVVVVVAGGVQVWLEPQMAKRCLAFTSATLLFLLSVLLSAAWSTGDFGATLVGGLTPWWSLWVIPAIALAPPDVIRHGRTVALALGLAMIPAVSLGVYQAATGTDPLRPTVSMSKVDDYTRPRGFHNTMGFAGCCGVVMVAAVGMLLYQRRLALTGRMAALGIAGITALGLVLTVTRGNLIAALVVSVGGLMLRGWRWAMVVWVVGLCAMMGVLASGAERLAPVLSSRVAGVARFEPVKPPQNVDSAAMARLVPDYVIRIETNELRFMLWSGTLWLWIERPVFGYGPGPAWDEAIDTHAHQIVEARLRWPNQPLPDDERQNLRNPHNIYLGLLAHYGVFGLAIAGVWVLVLLRDLWRNRPLDHDSGRGLWAAAMAATAFVALSGVIDRGIYDLHLRLPWLLLVGMALWRPPTPTSSSPTTAPMTSPCTS